MRALRDNLIIKIDISLPNQADILLPVNTDKWREAKDQISNRGTVEMAGNGKRHPKTTTVLKPHCKKGDIVRFSELEYPSFTKNGTKYIIISDQDIVGVEQ